MKSKSGTFMKRAVMAGVIAGGGILAASAYAISADRSGDTPRCDIGQMQKDKPGWEGRRAAHLAGLKEKLALTADQEAAWNAFTAASPPGLHRPGLDRKAMREEFEKLNTPARLDRMQAMAEMRQARMAERAEATKAFYAQLSPEQQSVFDAEAMTRRHRGHHHRHHS